MKRLAIAFLVVVSLLAAGAGALVLWANSEFTECYARFASAEDAEAAASDLDVDVHTERRGGRVAESFVSGATGQDAVEVRRAFRPAVREHGGELGHGGDGCLERAQFM